MKVRMFARPEFPLWILPCLKSNQADFCPCTLPRISDPSESTFGLRRYLFGGVPPQPNCLPTSVPYLSKVSKIDLRRWYLTFRLIPIRRLSFNNFHLACILKSILQSQATVKLHGVFTSHWGSLAFTPGKCVQRHLVRDSRGLVTPFMQAAN